MAELSESSAELQQSGAASTPFDLGFPRKIA